jgi:hypothetical protein
MSTENEWLIEKQLKDSDILTFTNNKSVVRGQSPAYTYKYVNFRNNLRWKLRELIEKNLTESMKANDIENSTNVISKSWIDGIRCELLQDGLEKKGKIRLKVTIEFIPDDLDEDSLVDERSPLDDIRQINLQPNHDI